MEKYVYSYTKFWSSKRFRVLHTVVLVWGKKFKLYRCDRIMQTAWIFLNACNQRLVVGAAWWTSLDQRDIHYKAVIHSRDSPTCACLQPTDWGAPSVCSDYLKPSKNTTTVPVWHRGHWGFHQFCAHMITMQPVAGTEAETNSCVTETATDWSRLTPLGTSPSGRWLLP